MLFRSGGIQMIDDDEADDKIIAVLSNDTFWDKTVDIGDLPPVLVERLDHYFRTYKLASDTKPIVRIDEIYGLDHAYAVIAAAIEDYNEAFANMVK